MGDCLLNFRLFDRFMMNQHIQYMGLVVGYRMAYQRQLETIVKKTPYTQLHSKMSGMIWDTMGFKESRTCLHTTIEQRKLVFEDMEYFFKVQQFHYFVCSSFP